MKYQIITTSSDITIEADGYLNAGGIIEFLKKDEVKEGAIFTGDPKTKVIYAVGTTQLISLVPIEEAE